MRTACKADGLAVTTVLEDKLADSAPTQLAPKPPAPNQPFALALGAAAATIIVILGVFAGPSIVSCLGAADGTGQCLQAKLRDAGLLPGGAAPARAEASVSPTMPAGPAPTPVAPAAEIALVEPALDVVPNDAAAAAALAAPESLVAANFGLLRAEPDGSVVIAGSGTPGSEVEVFGNGLLLGKSTVASSGDWVFVPDMPIAPGGTEITLGETGKEGLAPESFVVAINEDQTSEPLVVASTPGAASQVLQGLSRAAAQTTAAMAAASPPAPNPAPPAQSAPAAAPAPSAVAAPAPDPAPIAASAPPAAPAATAAATPTPAVATPPAAAAPAPVVAAAAPAPVVAAPPPVAPAEPALAMASAAPATPATPLAAAPADVTAPTIDAVEVEGDRAFFAGSGTNGTTVRLYVDDIFIADTPVATGRWLIEAGNVLTKPSQRVRVDMLGGSGDVLARAEVDFAIELPADSTAVAATEPTAAPVDVNVAAAAATEAAAPAIPTMVAVSIGNIDDQRFAAGKAIIRRGDNLWTIARRAYGEGMKYTTIYQANTGQIRNPDRIYPGQVFDLPDSTAN